VVVERERLMLVVDQRCAAEGTEPAIVRGLVRGNRCIRERGIPYP
jgi:hypothetical protein